MYIHSLSQSFLNRFEHTESLNLLVQLRLHLLVGSVDVVARHQLNLWQLNIIQTHGVVVNKCLVAKDVIVGVGRPEPLDELLLSDVALVLGVESREESFGLLVRKTEVKPDDRVLKLWDRDCLRVVCVDHAEALVDRDVQTHQVVTNLLENAAFPFHGVLGF